MNWEGLTPADVPFLAAALAVDPSQVRVLTNRLAQVFYFFRGRGETLTLVYFVLILF
jgi:hypothetical protein